MKKAIYVVILLVSILSCLEAQDTEIPILEYGDKIRAKLPLSSLESEFQFEGKAGDIIVIDVRDNDTLSGLYPEITLLNKRGVQIASTSYMDDNVDNLAMMPIELPVDGRYTILVTPGEFSFVQHDAPFTLRLLQPQILESGIAVRESVESDFPAYYVFLAETAFTVEYELLGGKFSWMLSLQEYKMGFLR